MSLEEIQRLWQVRIPTVSQTGSSSGGGAAGAICVKGVRGAAFFCGPDSAPADQLLGLWFVAGVKTDKGVGIGSTVPALRRAYGTALKRVRIPIYARAYWVVERTARVPRRAIVFVIPDFGPSRGRVASIGFGYRADMIDSYPINTVYC